MTVSDITSPTVLLTGPTGGIGAGMLRALVRHPSRPRLLLLARERARLDAALEHAREAGLAAFGVTVDLADLESVRTAMEEVRALVEAGTVGAIDAALLNAGAQFMTRRSESAQGHERAFAVNVIAQHAMVEALEPVLAPAGHIVVLGSSTHRGKRQSFHLIPDPQWQEPADLATIDGADAVSPAAARERGGIAYASSKLALVTVAHAWARRVGATGRRLNVYDPGLTVRTGLVRDMPAYRYFVWRYLMPVLALHPKATTARVTGAHAVALALGDRHRDLHDGYVEIGALTAAEPVTFDLDRQQRLAEWLDAAVAPFLPEPASPARSAPAPL